MLFLPPISVRTYPTNSYYFILLFSRLTCTPARSCTPTLCCIQLYNRKPLSCRWQCVINSLHKCFSGTWCGLRVISPFFIDFYLYHIGLLVLHHFYFSPCSSALLLELIELLLLLMIIIGMIIGIKLLMYWIIWSLFLTGKCDGHFHAYIAWECDVLGTVYSFFIYSY